MARPAIYLEGCVKMLSLGAKSGKLSASLAEATAPTPTDKKPQQQVWSVVSGGEDSRVALHGLGRFVWSLRRAFGCEWSAKASSHLPGSPRGERQQRLLLLRCRIRRRIRWRRRAARRQESQSRGRKRPDCSTVSPRGARPETCEARAAAGRGASRVSRVGLFARARPNRSSAPESSAAAAPAGVSGGLSSIPSCAEEMFTRRNAIDTLIGLLKDCTTAKQQQQQQQQQQLGSLEAPSYHLAASSLGANGQQDEDANNEDLLLALGVLHRIAVALPAAAPRPLLNTRTLCRSSPPFWKEGSSRRWPVLAPDSGIQWTFSETCRHRPPPLGTRARPLGVSWRRRSNTRGTAMQRTRKFACGA